MVVLDWAGTTIDFGSCAPVGAFVATFSARGVPVTLAEARAPMGLHKKDHLRAMLREPAVAARWRSAVGREWAEADVEDLYRDVTPRQLEAVERYGALIPGVLDCVAGLKSRGIKIAGSTGYFSAAAKLVVEAGQRQGYTPDYSICADDVPAGRPAPWMIYRAMEALDVYPPRTVVKVGDTIVDIIDGLNAGVWSFGIVDSSNEMGLSEDEFKNLSESERESRRAAVRDRYLAAGAHKVLNSIAELPEIIDGMNIDY
jgi:phosphonoacetaldehyde hydrolase